MKKALKIIFWLLFAALMLAAFDVRLKTVHYTVESDKISAPVRIALVTDLHSCRYGDGENNLISAIDAQTPDVVLLGGDIFDDELPTDRAETFLRRLGSRYECYYVTGNHEFRSGRVEEMCDYVSSCGITVLHGECVPLRLNGQQIDLYGVDDTFAGFYGYEDLNFYLQLKKLDPESMDGGSFSILLSHHPEKTALYESHKFNLILSGHAHGGQWRIPGLVNGILAPNQRILAKDGGQGFFPDYTGGEYFLSNGSEMIVSRGLARESTRIPRIFNRPELVIVDIT